MIYQKHFNWHSFNGFNEIDTFTSYLTSPDRVCSSDDPDDVNDFLEDNEVPLDAPATTDSSSGIRLKRLRGSTGSSMTARRMSVAPEKTKYTGIKRPRESMRLISVELSG